MKGKKGRLPARALRRVAALAAAAALLRGMYAAVDFSALRAQARELLSGGAVSALLLGQELGMLPGEETAGDLWDELALSQLPQAAAAPAQTAQEESAQTAAAPAGEFDAAEEQESGDPAPAEDPPAEELPAAPESNVVAQTMTAGAKTITAADIALNNSTDHTQVDLAALLAAPLTQTRSEQGPQILIMHTHGSEAYTMEGDDVYPETDTARTTDANFNMIRIGEEMKAEFESMGLSVVHDTTLYDYPTYTGSYGRSLEGIRAMLEQYPSISIVLDVHRDALIAQDGTVYKAVTELDGQQAAQVMLVMGSEDGGLTHPGWQQNLALALRVQQGMLAICPTLPRPINLRSQRFNQHMTAGSMLVEVGTSGNTLQEAILGARAFARAAGEVFLALPVG